MAPAIQRAEEHDLMPGTGVLMRGVLADVKRRHITVTNYCPVLHRFIERNPGYVPLIDSGNPGNWPKRP